MLRRIPHTLLFTLVALLVVAAWPAVQSAVAQDDPAQPAQPTQPAQPDDPPAVPIEPDSKTVTLGHADPPVGASMKTEQKRNLDLVIEVLMGQQVAQTMKQADVEEYVRTIEITKVGEGGHVTQVRVKYDSHTSKRTQNGRGESRPAAHVGKTYLATVTADGKIVVTYDGAEGTPGAEEAAVIEGDAKHVVSGGFSELLPKRPLVIGEVISPDLKKATELMGTPAEIKLVEFTLTPVTVKEINGRQCLLMTSHMKLEARPARPALVITFVQDGAQWLDMETGAQLGSEMTGPVSVTGSQKAPDGSTMEFRGEGTQTASTKNTLTMPEKTDDGDE